MTGVSHVLSVPTVSQQCLPRRADTAEEEHATEIVLSLPNIHCSGCISKVEQALAGAPGVRSARVNLTLKRVTIDAGNLVTPDQMISAVVDAGFEAHELDTASLSASSGTAQSRHLLICLAVAGFAMMNVMLLSVAVWSGAEAATRDMFHWISAAIALPAIAFSSRPFFVNAWTALRVGRLNMDVPISLAIFLASAMSVYEISQSGEHAYFDAALSLTFFLLAGRYLDHRTRNSARSAAQELTALEVPRTITPDGRTVAVADLRPDDVIRVLPGARVPVDGIVAHGASEIDRSLLTGEALPASVQIGQVVSSGEINLMGPLDVRVTAAGKDSSLHRLATLVEMAETSRNRYTSLAEKAARIYAPLVHLLALAAFAGWYWTSGDVRLSLNIAIAVLIITCPCALGLAVPAVSAAASGRLFRAGMLIKNATALERLAIIDTVVFDKTGTLTIGQPEPANLHLIPDRELEIAMALGAGSAHPLAMSLARAGHAEGLTPANVTDIKEWPGQGIEGTLQGQQVMLGRAAWVGANPIDQTATYLRVGDGPTVVFSFKDALRDGAEATVTALADMGKDLVILSGDTKIAVEEIAARLGIQNWEADMLPSDKAERVSALTNSGHKVLMIGDGLNDTAALAGAHVSISPASALDAARVVSDIVLLGSSLMPITEALEVARLATRRIKENFAIAAVYNLVAVPLALAGFATPLAAALAMSGSSISVSLNALRLVRR